MIFLVLCAIAPFVDTHGIHESMTADEIKQVFQTTPDDVPEYEVVPVKHTFHKKADNYIIETAFQNSKITFNLKQTDSILVGKHTKVWIGKKNSYQAHGIEYKLVENAFENIGTFYEDPENLATFRIMDENKQDDEDKMNSLVQKPLLLDGSFTINGKNIVLRSLPTRHHFEGDIHQSDSSSSEENNTNLTATFNHVVFQIREPPHLEKSRPANSFVENFDGSEITRISKQSIPEVVYPELMLVVDEKIYLEFDGNVAKALSYIVTFWNGVDLRYRSLTEPKVRLNIAGIILSEDKLPYIDSFFRDQSKGHIALDADVALLQFGSYFYKEHRFSFKKDYDIALLMTGYDLQAADENTGQMQPTVAGVAYHGGACRQQEGEYIMAVGLIEDTCGFSGILTAAHELAHSLGAFHDHEGIFLCDNGFLMSGAHGANMINPFHFTNCSQAEMRLFFQSQYASCLLNAPPKDEPVPMILPGQVMSLDEQCRKRGYVKAFNYDATVCTMLCCIPENILMLLDRIPCGLPAADGSPCEKDSYCLDGVCVYEF